MHSSRIRTIRSSSRLLGGVSASGGVCPGGVYLGNVCWGWGVCWGYLPGGMYWGRHPPVNRMTERQV